MKTAQEAVKAMMRVYDQATPDCPTMPVLPVRILRASLILEEALELITEGLGIEAQINVNGVPGAVLSEWLLALRQKRVRIFDNILVHSSIEKTQDGCSDLHVVTLGTEVACGLDAEAAFNEVMRSNMSKLWTREEVLRATQEIGFESGGCDGRWVALSNGWVAQLVTCDRRAWLVKNELGKVVKSPSYSPANLKQLCVAGGAYG
jgi:predicted HAD superfamily Cof-like phosphohydrolase